MALCCAGALWGSGMALAQRAPSGDWPLPAGDAGQSGWQKNEVQLSKDTAGKFKFLWKLKLEAGAKESNAFTEPILIQRLVTALGFKDFAYYATPTALYGVDNELGEVVWTKKYDVKPAGSGACSPSALSALMEPPPVINFNAAPRKPTDPPPPPVPLTPPGERRIGLVPPPGASRPVRGVYVLTSDGMLHQQIITSGLDFATPVRFLPAANSGNYGMMWLNDTMYAATGNNCPSVPNGVFSFDMSSPAYKLSTYATGKIRPLALTGPTVGADGTAYIVTGPGTSTGTVYADSVIALNKDMTVKGDYTPGGSLGIEHVSPVLFRYKGKELLVAPGKDGSIVLLDAAAIGGADHHTALASSPSLYKAGKHPWDSFAAWTDKTGTTWVYAAISGPVAAPNGSLAHGGIVAFKVEGDATAPKLTMAWVSPDMVNPAPPRIANGLIVALAGGNASTHGVLHLLDAETGAALYSSKDEIVTYTGFSGVAVGEAHAFFTDHDNNMYSFGIGMIH